MRVAALYDVHGNLPALEAVLADARCAEVDTIVSGGDLVAGPLPARVPRAARSERRAGRGSCAETATASVAAPPTRRRSGAGARRARRRAARSSRDGRRPSSSTSTDSAASSSATRRRRRDEEILTRLTPDEASSPRRWTGRGARRRLRAHARPVRPLRRRRAARQRRQRRHAVRGPPGAYWALLGDGTSSSSRPPYDVEAAVEAISSDRLPDVRGGLARSLLGTSRPRRRRPSSRVARGA